MHRHDPKPGFIRHDHDAAPRGAQRRLQFVKSVREIVFRRHAARKPQGRTIQQRDLIPLQSGKRGFAPAFYGAPFRPTPRAVLRDLIRHLVIARLGGRDIAKPGAGSGQTQCQIFRENRFARVRAAQNQKKFFLHMS